MNSVGLGTSLQKPGVGRLASRQARLKMLNEITLVKPGSFLYRTSVSSTHPWLSVLRPNSRPSVITSLARPISLSLLRDHQTTPPTTTPTTRRTTTIATASSALSQPGIMVLLRESEPQIHTDVRG